MHIERKRQFLITFVYDSVLLICCYLFFQYILPITLPFFIGFFIAFLLRTPVRFMASYTNGHETLWATFFLILFYTILLLILLPLLYKGGMYIKSFLEQLPFLYQEAILPYFAQPYTATLSTYDTIFQQVSESIWNGLLQALSAMISNIISSFFYTLQTFITQLPNIILSCFLAIFSSILFQLDYSSITQFLLYQLPIAKQDLVIATSHYLKQTLLYMLKTNVILMFLTWVQLTMGFWIIGINQPYMLALLIAIFDALPIFGTGGILLPWILMNILYSHTSFAISLSMLYLIITIIRNILEPKIMGKQLGLHPMILLIGMYIGGKLLGIIGMILLPNILTLLRCLHDEGYLQLYKLPNEK